MGKTNSFSESLQLDRIVTGFGLDRSTEKVLLRRGTNYVIALPDCGAVLRIAEEAPEDWIRTNLRVVSFLADRAAVLGPKSNDVVVAGDMTATLWPMGEANTGKGAYRGLGKSLRSLRGVEPRELDELDSLNLLDNVQGRMPRLKRDGVPNAYLQFFAQQLDELADSHHEMIRSGNFIVHADAHIGNTVNLYDECLLIDMDDVCVGPWQYDLIPSYVRSRRMGDVRQFEELQAGYGESITDWEYLEVAARLRELTMTSWLGTLWNIEEEYRQEFCARMDSLIEGTNTKWKAV